MLGNVVLRDSCDAISLWRTHPCTEVAFNSTISIYIYLSISIKAIVHPSISIWMESIKKLHDVYLP